MHKPRILYHPDLCFDLAQQNVRETDRETRTAAQANKTWKQSIAKKIFSVERFFSPPSIRSEAGVTVREGEEKKSDWRCPPWENTYLTYNHTWWKIHLLKLKIGCCDQLEDCDGTCGDQKVENRRQPEKQKEGSCYSGKLELETPEEFV